MTYARLLNSCREFLKLPSTVCLLGLATVLPTHAADLYWKSDGSGTGTGGTGIWDTSNNRWKTTQGGSIYQAWPTTDPSTSVARFATASTLTIANDTTIYANGLNFGADTSITSGNGASRLVINGTSPTITLSTATAYLNTTVELAGSTAFTSSTASGNVLAIGRATSTPAVTGSLTASSGVITLFSSSNRGTLSVGQTVGAPTLGSSNGTVNFAGAEVNANLSGLRVGQMFVTSNGSSTATTVGGFDFGTNSASTIHIEANLPVGIGLGGGIASGRTHAGTTSGTLNTQAGTHTYTALSLSEPVVKIGEMTSTGGATNGTNVSTVTGAWNISGGITTLTPAVGFPASTYISILLANRTTDLGVNTTVAGTLNLTGGTLNLAGGHIAEANNVAGATSTVTLNGGTLNLNGGSIGLSTGLIDNLSFQSGTLSNVGQINSGHATQGILNKTTSGTLRLNGSNTYTAGTTLTQGTLQAGSDTAFGSGAINLTAGKLSSDSITARAISNAVTFGGDVTLGDGANTGVLTFNGAGTLTGNRTITTESNVTYAVAIGETGGARSLTKAGTGSLEFSAVNTYTGSTLVSAGTLLVSGTGSINASSGLTVNGGTLRYNSSTNLTAPLIFTSGTLAGTNFAGKTLSIGTNQTISPGNSTGKLASASQTWAGGGTYEWEINDATGTAGANGWDLLNITGDLTITANSGSQFNINVISLSSQVAGLAANFDSLVNGAWLIADATSAITTFDASAFHINLTQFQNAYSGVWSVALGGSGSFGGDNSQIYLTYSVIPEPSTTLLLAGALTVLVIFRRRRE